MSSATRYNPNLPLANLRKEKKLKLKKQNKRISLKSKKKEKNIKVLILFFVIILIIYIFYAIINLVIKPVDIVLVEEGKIYSEETVVGYIIREEEVIGRRKL